VRGEDGLRTQRCGAQALENAALAVDRDDRHERQHRADGDQDRREDRQIDADHAAVGERGPSTPHAACEPSERHEDHDGDEDRPQRAQRLAQEDLGLEPGQLPESV